ncbi:hypothetical protein [Ornithinibacillus scapharcae]|uniref:hypothetical protein n=1 Tax=Ornithinibacillus scapharcae TaxID=1147159 RepID=UPI0002D73859|nr:hypothetical protein [Ornithinibacillus scapharcae]
MTTFAEILEDHTFFWWETGIFVTYVIDGISPGYSFPVEAMRFAVNIDSIISIDEYEYGFIEDDQED